MAPLHGAGTCPECGRKQSTNHAPHQLAPGTILASRYLVGCALGQGGFGITYIGRDLTLDMRVAIKEYYPTGYANRNTDVSDSITQTNDKSWTFVKNGKKHFLDEARTLARFRGNRGIVDVLNFFEANSTAYIIMDYLEGDNLKAFLEDRRLSPDEAFECMQPIMDALEQIHAEHVIHRDISPDNIMRLSDGALCLMDFGAARVIDFNDQHTVSMVLKAGYAPQEQYRAKGKLGPWTDIYALCATIYKAVTGITPDESLQRLFEDELKWPSELGVPITAAQEAILKKGMAPKPEDRYQSIAELRADLQQATALASLDNSTQHSTTDAATDADSNARRAVGELPADLDPNNSTPNDSGPHADTDTYLAKVAPAAARLRKRMPVVALAGAACIAALAIAVAVLWPAKATISFDTAGGSPVASIEADKSAQIKAPAAPTRSTYTFDGWYYDETHQQRAEFPLSVQDDTTLHAAWKKATVAYTVKYLDRATKNEVASKKSIAEVQIGKKVTEKAPSIEGYKLVSPKEKGLFGRMCG